MLICPFRSCLEIGKILALLKDKIFFRSPSVYYEKIDFSGDLRLLEIVL